MRSSPKSSGQGLSEATHAVAGAVLAGESFELTPVAGELLSFRIHDLGRRPLDEPVVGQHALGARDLLAQALDLGSGIAVALRAGLTDDGREDPLLVGLERGRDAAAPDHLGRLLDARK